MKDSTGIENTLFTPKKAISYLRVSTRGQAERGGGDDEGFSIPAQREANRKKAASLGAIIVKEFVDRGASAKSVDRKDLQNMLEYIAETPVDYCIIHKVDRLIRNRWDDADISRALVKHNVKLVSTMESIDETPAGMLMHGIMASIAEFYSNNLATEVIKGMSKKAEKGGTISKAPLAYKNIRHMDEMGREERYVILDEERAPLAQLGFQEFATGNWVVNDLAEYLALRGLTTRATPKIPSKPIDGNALGKMFKNPYYKGLVMYKGKQYPGKHPALIDEETWQKVQDVLSTHVHGERTREHPHFLKSTVYCGSCGERLIIQYARSRSGVRYPYFSCAGRHSKRNDCLQKSLLIAEIERQIENLYHRISFTPELRQKLEEWLLKEIRMTAESFATERRGLELEKDKLSRQQRKLLEAHYADAIPIELFKEEQRKIADAISAINKRIQIQGEHSTALETKLSETLELLENCGTLYASAPENIKRTFNQALFKKIHVHNNDDGISVAPEFTSTYALILGGQSVSAGMPSEKPLKTGFARFVDAIYNLKSFLKNKNHDPNFFGHGFSKGILVEATGFEPATPASRTQYSTKLSHASMP